MNRRKSVKYKPWQSFYQLNQQGREVYNWVLVWIFYIMFNFILLRQLYDNPRDTDGILGTIYNSLFIGTGLLMAYQSTSLRRRQNLINMIPLEPRKQVHYIIENYFSRLVLIIVIVIPIELVILTMSNTGGFLKSLSKVCNALRLESLPYGIGAFLLFCVLSFPLIALEHWHHWLLYAVMTLGIECLTWCLLLDAVWYRQIPLLGKTAAVYGVFVLEAVLVYRILIWQRSSHNEL